MVVLSGCSPAVISVDDRIELTIPTYDGSGQVAHPTVIDFLSEYGLEQWGGYRFWMSGSPYPGANDFYENPCLWVSDDGLVWEMPDGIEQPLANAPRDYHRRNIYNSDPTIVYNPLTDEIELYYRESRGREDEASIELHRIDICLDERTSGVDNRVDPLNGPHDAMTYRVRPVTIVTTPFTRSWSILSPSVVIDDEGVHYMFAVSNAVEGSYGVIVMNGGTHGILYDEPLNCLPGDDQYPKGPEGLPPFEPWHLCAKRRPDSDEITMLINGQVFGSKTRMRNLFWAHTSFDDLAAMVIGNRDPIIEATSEWQPYRSTFVDANDELGTPLRLWINGYTTRPPQHWSIFYIEK